MYITILWNSFLLTVFFLIIFHFPSSSQKFQSLCGIVSSYDQLPELCCRYHTLEVLTSLLHVPLGLLTDTA